MAIIPIDLTTDEIVIDLLGWNNQYLQITFDMSAWVAIPYFPSAVWAMQVRSQAKSASIVLDLAATMLSPFVTFYSPRSAAAVLLGTYDWDFGFSLPSTDFRRCAGGTLEMRQGVTR